MSQNPSQSQKPPLVITMWETYGSNMEAIAERLAADLKLPLHKQAYSSEALEQAEAQRERQGRFGAFQRHMLAAMISPDGLVMPMDATLATNDAKMADDNLAIVRKRAEGGGVLQGRNGQYLLRDRPNTVHVKLDGPLQARIRRAAQEHNLPEERAKKRQRLEDEFRSELSQKMYNFDPRDNGWYDIVINGAELSTEDAVHLIKEAVKVFAK